MKQELVEYVIKTLPLHEQDFISGQEALGGQPEPFIKKGEGGYEIGES